MKRNVVNHEQIPAFLARLEIRHPTLKGFIHGQVKTYLLNKESTFVYRDDSLGMALCFKKLFSQASPAELSMLKHQGVSGNYLFLKLNERCFEQYSHYLDCASMELPRKLAKISLDEIINRSRTQRITKRIKIKALVQDVDFRSVAKIKNYDLVELISLTSFINEGQEMSHCVGTYVKPTSNRKMYSLRDENQKPVMTLNVDVFNKKIIEAKGFKNSSANMELLTLVRRELKVGYEPYRIHHPHLPMMDGFSLDIGQMLLAAFVILVFGLIGLFSLIFVIFSLSAS